MCRNRDRLYKRARRSGRQAVYRLYRAARKQVKIAIKRDRDEYLIKMSGDSSKCWQVLRKFGLIRSKGKSPLQFFDKDTLIQYYTSVTSAHPPCPTDVLQSIISDQSGPSSVRNNFRFKPLEPTEVLQMMHFCLPKAKSRSCDGLSLTYFQDVLSKISPFITDLFNLSITTATYPTIWKESIIVPHSKVPTPDSPSDTRPVANIPHFAKVFDTLITKQIAGYLEENNLISSYQSGFRSNHSTDTALLKISEDIRSGAQRGLLTILLLFDFRRAFDTINHEILLRKLKQLGFSANTIAWFHSYLTGRSQAVVDPD